MFSCQTLYGRCVLRNLGGASLPAISAQSSPTWSLQFHKWHFHVQIQNTVILTMFCLSYERPILGDNPKPHKFACEKHCTFHFLLCFSLNSVALFTEKHCAFHFSLCFSLHFSLKRTSLFTFCCTFHWKELQFSLFAALFTEKHCTFYFSLHFSLKSTKTTDSTQISQFDLVFHRVQR